MMLGKEWEREEETGGEKRRRNGSGPIEREKTEKSGARENKSD